MAEQGQILTPEQMKSHACQHEVNEVLNRHGFVFIPFFIVENGQLSQGVRLGPKPTLTPEQEAAMKKEMDLR